MPSNVRHVSCARLRNNVANYSIPTRETALLHTDAITKPLDAKPPDSQSTTPTTKQSLTASTGRLPSVNPCSQWLDQSMWSVSWAEPDRP